MKTVFTILTVLFASVFVSGTAYAQIYGTGKTGEKQAYSSYQTLPNYNAMVRNALKNKPKKFDFMQLRIYYARTPHYDPIGQETLDLMNRYAYIMMNEEDEERVKSATLAYQAVVSNHLAHIDVILQALSFARQDRRFGKPAFFEWMRDGLIKTVVISGSGFSLQQAYDIITMQEETILLQRLGFRKIESFQRHEGVIYYNMHDVENVETGRKFTIFVNTSIPMKFLERQEEEAEKYRTLNIRKQ